MFTEKTVFILGAGASKPYGFPTGQKLVETILEEAKKPEEAHWLLKGSVSIFSAEERKSLDKLLKSFETFEGSIDNWLAKNPGCQAAGKHLITRVIAQCETPGSLHRNAGGGCYSILWEYLINSVKNDFQKIGESSADFVTFNYDRSLEQTFYEKARSDHPDLDEESLVKAIQQITVVHLHGQIGRLPWRTAVAFEEKLEELPHDGGRDASVGKLRSCSNGIVLAGDAEDLSGSYKMARTLLGQAAVVHFIGFGFDEENMRRLLGGVKWRPQVRLSATVYGLGRPQIEELRYPGNIIGRKINDVVDVLANEYCRNYVAGHRRQMRV